MTGDLGRLSRVVSHALRHEPWLYALELDEDGWADVNDLLAALRQEDPGWTNLTQQDLKETIRACAKRRHEVKDGRIRALYGHSLPGNMTLMARYIIILDSDDECASTSASTPVQRGDRGVPAALDRRSE